MSGMSSRYYPTQPAPPFQLDWNNSYYQVKIHDAQVVFAGNWFQQADTVLVSTEVALTANPDKPIKSLYKVDMIQRNTPMRLGLSPSLTDWLPAQTDSQVHLTLQYTVVQGTPFKTLLDKMVSANLAGVASLIRPDLGVALKITEIVGRVISYFAGEGNANNVFALTMDLSSVDLQAGYHVTIGSKEDVPRLDPALLKIDSQGQLVYTPASTLDRLSYLVIQVQGIPQRQSEAVRWTTWGTLLATAQAQILDEPPPTDAGARQQAFIEWRAVLKQVRALARQDRSFLLTEIDGVIAAAQKQVEAHLVPPTAVQSAGLNEYDDAWQDVLGVSSKEELLRSVRDYQDALMLTEALLQHYNAAVS